MTDQECDDKYWPHEEGSADEMAFEVIGAKTKQYRIECLEEFRVRIHADGFKAGVEAMREAAIGAVGECESETDAWFDGFVLITDAQDSIRTAKPKEDSDG